MLYTPRSIWGAKAGIGADMPKNVGVAVIHNAYLPDVPASASPAEEMAALRAMESFHVNDRGWNGIAYQWIVFQSGRIYEGRGWGRTGAHCPGMNDKSYGILFVINGQIRDISKEGIEGGRSVLREAVRAGWMVRNYRPAGHREFVKRTCPGDKVMKQIPLFAPEMLREPMPKDLLSTEAKLLVDARWQMRSEVEPEDLVDAMKIVHKLLGHPSVASEPAARVLREHASDVLGFYEGS